MSSDFQSFKQAVLQLKETNAQLERELQASKQELAYLRKTVAGKRSNSATPVAKPTPKIETELKRIQQETQEARNATAYASRLQHISEAKAHELNNTLKQLTQVNSTLERERELAKQEVAAMQEERKALRTQLRDLREQLRANTVAKGDLEEEKESRATSITQLTQEKKDLLAKATSAEFKYKELKETLTSVKGRKGDAEKAKIETEERLRKTFDELRSSKERAKNAEQRARDLADAISALTRQKEEIEADLARIRPIITRHEDANRGWGDHKKYLENKVAKLEQLVRQLTLGNDQDISKDRTEAAERRVRLNSGTKPEFVIQELEDHVAQLQQRNRAVARDREELSNYADRLARHSAAEGVVEGENSSLLESMAALRAEKAELEHERNVARRQVDRHKREMTELKQDNQRYVTQLERLRSSLASLESGSPFEGRRSRSQTPDPTSSPLRADLAPLAEPVRSETPATTSTPSSATPVSSEHRQPTSTSATPSAPPARQPGAFVPASQSAAKPGLVSSAPSMVSSPASTPLVDLLKQEEIQRQVLVDHERIAFRAVVCIAQDKLKRLLGTPA